MTAGLSLRVKLTLGYVLVFTVILLLGGLGVYFAAERTLMNSLDDSLRSNISLAQGSLEMDNGQVRFTPELKPAGEISIELLKADGTVIAQVGDREKAPTTPQAVKVGLSSVGTERVLTQALPNHQFLRVAKPTESTSEFLETLARILLLGSTAMIALACAAGYWLAHRALKPVDAVARTAKSIAQQGDYAQRVPHAPGRDEMARLTGTVNEMLDQLAGTIEREKQFARIAAHELRTPLATLQGRLEVTLDRPRSAPEYEKALTGMQGMVGDLTQLSESLLALARTDAPVQLERVEMAAVAFKVSETLEDTAARYHKQIHLDLEESWVQAERDGLERAITNLLENALKYGENGQVTLRVKAGEVMVENAGSGPAQDRWEQLLKPFERGPGMQGVSGSGLGLALVASLARRWQAQLLPQWRPGLFSIRLIFPQERP